MKTPLLILKIGGNVLADDDVLNEVLDWLAGQPQLTILVHGGGRRASELQRVLGHEPKMVNGRRITDEATLEVVTMVYAGLVNKTLVARLQARQCPAIGLSGADGNLIEAHRRVVKDIDYGYAGDIDRVNVSLLQTLLSAGLCPVCCPITHDRRGQLLNTNADTIAASLATALAPHYAVSLQYCFEKAGVLTNPEDETSVIPILKPDLYRQHVEAGAIHSGMIPKLDNAFSALKAGVEEVVVGHQQSLIAQTATRIRLQ
ncbi:MAG: acetylglutamate kinase [Lewinella sp.]|nr:acetylglutamate kinase [Lewinella sp.]